MNKLVIIESAGPIEALGGISGPIKTPSSLSPADSCKDRQSSFFIFIKNFIASEWFLNINKMFNILWNVYVFSTTYMSLDDFNPIGLTEDDMILRSEDKWIISKANTLVKEVAEDLDKLFFHKATRKINDFILEDLSRWYVRLIRGRTWVESDDPDKLGAYYSL